MFQGEISAPPERPRDAMAPVAETIAPFVPVPGLGPAARLMTDPRVLGPAIGLGSYFGLPEAAGAGEDLARIKDLQQTLKNAGYYKGPIDGVMGNGTQEANERYQRDQLERQKIEAERGAAEAARAESERKRLELEQSAKQRQAGEDRLKKLADDTPTWEKFGKDYGPYLGYVPGLWLGHRFRGSMTGAFNRQSAAAAEKANQLVAGGRRNFESRVGGVNTFWQEGGAATVPFPPAPRARAGVRSDPQAPSATTLYPSPPRISEYARARDVAVGAGAGAEVAFSAAMANHARTELEDARKAVAADPSEANIQRMQAAETQAAAWEGMANVGRGIGLGYLTSMPFARYQPTRPNVSAAEAERLRLDAVVNPRRRR